MGGGLNLRSLGMERLPYHWAKLTLVFQFISIVIAYGLLLSLNIIIVYSVYIASSWGEISLLVYSILIYIISTTSPLLQHSLLIEKCYQLQIVTSFLKLMTYLNYWIWDQLQIGMCPKLKLKDKNWCNATITYLHHDHLSSIWLNWVSKSKSKSIKPKSINAQA